MTSLAKPLSGMRFAQISLIAVLLLCVVGPSMSSWQPEDIDWQSIQTAPLHNTGLEPTW